MKYFYFLLQHILNQHPKILKPTFLDASFEFVSNVNKNIKNEVRISNSQLHAISTSSIKISEDEIMSKLHFYLVIQHHLETNQLSCTTDASLDQFNRDTTDVILQRFYSMLEQLFSVTGDQMKKSVYEYY
jgi:hypothetical protein